jgi:hypothetical protein
MTIKKPLQAGEPRPLSNIAHDIRRAWPNVNYAARPYLAAMLQLGSIRDNYIYDSGADIVRYFLANARAFKGIEAQLLKAELKQLLRG